MTDPIILLRWYTYTCQIATALDLSILLAAIPGAPLGEFDHMVSVGPEHAPGVGLASEVTHMLNAPMHTDEIFQAVRAIVRAHPGAMIQDDTWLVNDDGEFRYVTTERAEGSGDLMDIQELFFYDETINP